MKKGLTIFVCILLILIAIVFLFFAMNYSREQNNKRQVNEETHLNVNVTEDHEDIQEENNTVTTEDMETFTRTYKVLDKIEGMVPDHIFLTIRAFQEEEVETVKIESTLIDEIEIGSYYEFTFQYVENKVRDNIKSIFENANLISVVKTNKQGLEQKQDSIKGNTFVQTYNVLNIIESNDIRYIYLTIRAFQEEEVETVKVEKSLASSVKTNNAYEFTFEYPESKIEDNIKSVFEYSKLISIIKTDREGMDQNNEWPQ